MKYNRRKLRALAFFERVHPASACPADYALATGQLPIGLAYTYLRRLWP